MQQQTNKQILDEYLSILESVSLYIPEISEDEFSRDRENQIAGIQASQENIFVFPKREYFCIPQKRKNKAEGSDSDLFKEVVKLR